jgi:hypothetical protein
MNSLVALPIVAAMPVAAPAMTADDSMLLKLEEQIFEQYEAAHAHDDEIYRVFEIWTGESKRLCDEATREIIEGRTPSLTSEQRWDLVKAMPESKEPTRLVGLGEPFFEKMDALIKQMFALPAHTAGGRRAKVAVLISCVMHPEWTESDEDADYDVRMGRRLLIEFIGGEPGQNAPQSVRIGDEPWQRIGTNDTR